MRGAANGALQARNDDAMRRTLITLASVVAGRASRQLLLIDFGHSRSDCQSEFVSLTGIFCTLTKIVCCSRSVPAQNATYVGGIYICNSIIVLYKNTRIATRLPGGSAPPGPHGMAQPCTLLALQYGYASCLSALQGSIISSYGQIA